MPSNTILVCAPAGSLRDSLRQALGDAGHSVTVADDASAALAAIRQGTVDLVVADGLTVSDAVQSLRTGSVSRPTPIIVIAPGDDVEARIAFLEAGADDVLGAGFDAREIQARVEALLIRHGQIAIPATGQAALASGQVTAVYSAKGGAGTTTVAVNLALVLTVQPNERVLLVDLDLQFGQVATHLNLVPAFDLGGLVEDEVALREVDVAMSFLTATETGLWVLASPSSPEADGRISADDMAAAIAVFRSRFDRIVIDCGARFDARVMQVLDAADTHVVVVVPELAALKATSTLLSHLAETAALRARSLVVVNRIYPKELLKTSDVAQLLQVRIAAEIPYTDVHMIRAVNEGSPIVSSRPTSPAAVALRQIAHLVVTPETAEPARQQRRGLFRRG